ncbi:fatty acid synthase-like [Vespula squamosa]|uniref:oleoyl-[acyl-carrier-protein] hydrolase n=1 Tax=Vespula squamosa TaxID=30214 RepID=A0ABD2A6D7_VESSQ
MTEYKKSEESCKFFRYANPEPGEEIVISGFAGRFPKSNNVEELKDNLFNGKDCITDENCRWELDHPEIPKQIGKINNIEKFDALFFGIHFKQAHIMDPMSRMMLEHTYEAIVDAGINPEDIRGTRTGVFIGTCFSESEIILLHDKLQLGVIGPSYIVDTTCSSSFYVVEHAYKAIHNGQCDYAVVIGSNLCLHPYMSLQLTRLGMLNQDGRCKVFDEDANGYVRSKGVSVAFLQKAKTAKRIYATIIHAKTNCDDGSFTTEETILAAYSQGISVIEAKIPHFSVAVVGLGYKDVRDLCPDDIDVAYHNGSESSTIIGPAQSMKAFVEKLQTSEIIAKVLSKKRIPYHSRYIATVELNLLANLKKVIQVAKPRSRKWLSTSVSRNEWSTSRARFSSAEYFTNNLMRPVLFEETSIFIPNNAVTIQIAPHSHFLQEILGKLFQTTVMNIELNLRDPKNTVKIFLQALGKLYNAGLQLDLAKLYPSVKYPVSRGTPMISPLIRDTSIVMENVIFNRAITVPKEGKVEMIVMIQKGSGKFEVVEGGAAIVTGNIRLATNLSKEKVPLDVINRDVDVDKEEEELDEKDIYKEFKLRGYQYSGLFRSIHSTSVSRTGYIEWKKNWVAFMDSMLQMIIFNLDTRDLVVPIGIQKLVINTNVHEQYLQSVRSHEKYVLVQFFHHIDAIIAEGVEMHKVRTSRIVSKRTVNDLTIEEYKFTACDVINGGISISGRRIMGVNRNRCLSNFCHLDEIFSWTVPDNWNLEDAATEPCDKILIHAGSGGIGQAAINLALREGCEVFTTVGSPEKRKFIKETFPTIDDNHIGNSRDTSFEKMILQQTEGAGVDIILNSLAEDKLQAFHCVMLDKIINTNDTVKKRISSIFNKLIKENAIKPILRTVFGKHQVETAFRFMAAGKHMGKVLIKIREENESPNTPVLAEPSYTCIPHKSYIVLGGLGGFGLELIDWLVLRNAQNIVITSRNGVKNGYQRMRIKIWESYGVNIKILVGLDAAKKESCEHILKTAINNGPIDGIFNVAVSLKDSIYRNQTPQTFEEPFIGKAWATKCLDETTRKLCPDLRHFVVFSSVSCGRGNAGLMEMNIKPTDNSNSKNGRREEIFASGRMLMQFFGESPSTEITISFKTNPEKGRNKIFFLPGVEGYGSIFKTLESKIKSPATCFQLAANCELKTIQEMANLFLPHTLEKLQDRNDFVLVGFSFGSLVAIELTRNNSCIRHRRKDSKATFCFAILNAFVSNDNTELEFQLRKCNTLQAAIAYNPKTLPYIRTPIILFKPLLSSVRNAPYDYGLQNITEAKVDVHIVGDDHVTMLGDVKIAMAINGELFKVADGF